MSLRRLIKRLRREALANPKRAALLGLLVVVALWFWAPLVWGWIAGEESPTVTVAAPALSVVTTESTGDTPVASVAAKAEDASRYRWQELAEWMDNDARTAAANRWVNPRDPFVNPEPEQREQVVETESEDVPKPPPPDVTPEDLDLVLTSTIIGPSRRVARVSGKSYRQGEAIKVFEAGQEIEFKLVEVYPRRILLERDGKQFDLAIPGPSRPSRIELIESHP